MWLHESIPGQRGNTQAKLSPCLVLYTFQVDLNFKLPILYPQQCFAHELEPLLMSLVSMTQVRPCHGYGTGQAIPPHLHIMLHPYHLLNLHFLELCHCQVLKTIFTCKLQDQTQHAPFCMQLTFLHFHLMHFGTLYFPNYLIYVGNLKFGNHMLHLEEPLFKKNY